MHRFIKTALLLLAFSIWAEEAAAHVPKVVFPQEAPIIIESPERSKAYYAELAGFSQQFHILSAEPFWLSLELLVPIDSEGGTDFSARVELINGASPEPFAHLPGTTTPWTPFHEPFANDDFLAGPSFEGQAPAGEYRVVVESGDNFGKFVLSVGDVESFGPREFIDTVITLPTMKAYLGVSPLEAYTNRIGAIMLGVLLMFGAFVWLMFRIIRRRQVVKLPRQKA